MPICFRRHAKIYWRPLREESVKNYRTQDLCSLNIYNVNQCKYLKKYIRFYLIHENMWGPHFTQSHHCCWLVSKLVEYGVSLYWIYTIINLWATMALDSLYVNGYELPLLITKFLLNAMDESMFVCGGFKWICFLFIWMKGKYVSLYFIKNYIICWFSWCIELLSDAFIVLSVSVYS